MQFNLEDQYPNRPGFKDRDTSRLAAAAIAPAAKNIRDLVADCYLFWGPMTADEAAERLNLSILTVRPRVTELLKQGILRDSGTRRRNASGHTAKVFELKR